MKESSARTDRLLVIDDDPKIGVFVAKVAQTLGFETCECANEAEFKEAYREFVPTLIVTDLQMPGADGVEILRFLANEKC
ncbi:MAG: response regulator, partial [Proteobacteria bacterium]|nr:response regulator [Pseudomonadota bacterium]